MSAKFTNSTDQALYRNADTPVPTYCTLCHEVADEDEDGYSLCCNERTSFELDDEEYED
jgi:hypothetical protein